MTQPARALLVVTAVFWLAACSGSDNSSPQSTTNQSPTTAQEPTKPPPTTQPPNMAPPSMQLPGSQPTGSTPPGSGSGVAFTQGTGFNSDVRTIVMAQDGTHDLYVSGDFTTYNGTAANHLIRLHPNGSVASFGQGFDEVVTFIALATDNSNALYASGPFTEFNGQPVPHVIRLSPGGLRDATFQAGSPGFDFALAAVPEDGTRDVYVMGGISRSRPEGNSGLIARLNPDGTPDSTYPVVDFRTPGDTRGAATIGALAVPPGSGKLYVGGSMATYNGEVVGSFVRLNPDGTLDRSFGINKTSPSTSTTIVEAIAPARDGSGDVYAGGRIMNFSMRVHEDGEVDTSYAPTVPLVPNVICPAQDGTGDVFLSGFSFTTTSAGTSVFRLVRLDRTGALVSTFHEPTLGAEPPNSAYVLSIVPVLDGTRDLYIGGVFTTYNGVPVYHIARIHADGSLASVVN